MQIRTLLRRALVAGAAAVTLSGALPAQATPFQTGGFVINPPDSVSVISPSYGGGAGGFSGIWDPMGSHIPIYYWCYELTQVFSPGTTYDYTASILSTPFSNPDLSRLFTEVGGSAGALTDAMHSAAFQLAIWKLEYDPGSYLISSGAFKAVGGDPLAIAQAQAWLTGLLAITTPTYTVILLHSDTSQDFITDFTIPQRDLKVPEPTSLPLLGLGLAAMIFGMRRRATQASRL